MNFKKTFLLVTSAVGLLASCGDKPGTSELTSLDSSSETAPSLDLSFERGDKEVSLVGSKLYSRYFLNDSVEVEDELLSFFGGEMNSSRIEITDPDGNVSTNRHLTFSKLGKYFIKYIIDIYSGTTFAIKEIECTNYSDDTNIVEVEEIKARDKYYINNDFIAPKVALLNCFGKTLDGTYVKTISPSNENITDSNLSLSEFGVYKLQYKTQINGRDFFAYKNISTSYDLYSLNGSKSNADYNYTDIQLKIKGNEEFVINKVLDLSTYSSKTPLISFQFTPESVGTADALCLYVKLTDFYDDSNFIYVKVNKRFPELEYRSWADPLSYVFAKAPGQEELGKYEGNYGPQGYCTACSMVGNPAEDIMSLYFDYSTKQFLCNNPTSGHGTIVSDLDDEYFGENAWKGFKDGKCFMSIYAEDYLTPSQEMNISIKKILDLDLVNGAIGTIKENKIDRAYVPNSEVNFDLSATIEFNGKEIEAESAFILDPNNEPLENVSILSEEGNYKVIYKATCEGVTVVVPYTFTVTNPRVGLAKPIFDTYKLGTSFEVPSGALDFGDKYELNCQVKFPSGETANKGATVTLDEIGTYTYKVDGTVDGTAYNCEGTFKVTESGAYMSGNGSSIFSTTNPGWGDSVEMLGVNLKAGDTLTYNKLSKIDAILLSFRKQTNDEYKGIEITVTYTDATDSSKYFSIVYIGGLNGDWCTITAKVVSRTFTSPIVVSTNGYMGNQWTWEDNSRYVIFDKENAMVNLLYSGEFEIPELKGMENAVVTFKSNRDVTFDILDLDGRGWQGHIK